VAPNILILLSTFEVLAK